MNEVKTKLVTDDNMKMHSVRKILLFIFVNSKFCAQAVNLDSFDPQIIDNKSLLKAFFQKYHKFSRVTCFWSQSFELCV